MISPSTNDAKCVRFLTAFALALLLAGPAMLLWASRVELLSGDGYEATSLELEANQARQIASLSLPKGHARTAGLSPLGAQPLTPRLRFDGTRGLLLTSLGHLDPAQSETLLGLLPPALRLRADQVSRSERGTLQPGFNYVRISPAAIDARRGAEVNEALQSSPGIFVEGYLDEGWRLVYAEPRGLGALRQMGDLDRFVAMEPGLKIDTTLGFKPLINRARAQSNELHLEVYLARAADRVAVARDLRDVKGVSGVAEHGLNGLMVIADSRAVPGLAHRREVLAVREALEFMTLNAKNSPTIQVGSYEDGLAIRAFDEVGVDGGGLDTNGDGRRLNNGTDTVPPQLVAVTDNGISTDSPSFSQTATQPFIPITAPIGPAHRKVHGIIAVNDSGNGCDGVLSGSGTHGDIVASVIAAYPSQLGFFANRTAIGDSSVPRNSNMDGVARGARIIMQDVADSSRCTINSLIEKGGDVDPGSLATRMGEILAAGGSQVHLAVLPFGAPDNFSTALNTPTSDGTYPQEAVDLDTFLYNNRDFMIFSPVGNTGAQLNSARVALFDSILPDLFNGTPADNNPNFPKPVQVAPPATAKNVVSVGASVADCVTLFGASDCEIANALYSSHGPATPQSRRTAPIITAPSTDIVETADVTSIASFRSNDNDNLAPITAILDEANFGTSFSAAGVTGAAAIVRDYFAQGFYPLGTRIDANRVPNISGALVKAALIAGAKFNAGVSTRGQTGAEQNIRRTRSMNLGTIRGDLVGVFGNNEQGYGRALLTGVLPLGSWSKSFAVNPSSVPEYPAAGLLVWDDIATGEAPLDTTTTSRSHLFRLDSPNRVESRIGVPVGVTGGQAVKRGELRIALAWTDPPSPVDSGGPLVNDLDLLVESPGPDGCLFDGDTRHDGSPCGAGVETDNLFYDGNVYRGGFNNAVTDQWSRPRAATGVIVNDRRNPQEAVHLNSDFNNNVTVPDDAFRFDDSPLFLGTWRVTVKVGGGGATPGQLTITGPNEDLPPGNRRLDAGEDTNVNGLLDLGGQTYALVVAGPVFLAEAPPAKGPVSFPQSTINLNRVRYSCADAAVATVQDLTAGAGEARATASTTFTVRNSAGAVIDTEASVPFQNAGAPGASRSIGLPVRLGTQGVPNNGVLESDTGSVITATYAAAGQATVLASAQVKCSPDLVPGFFAFADNISFGQQTSISNGCDNDEFLDAGETLTYGVGIDNRSRTDDYTDVTATLTPSGPGAAAIRVLNSPLNVGRIPGNGFQGLFFQVFVDPAVANGLSLANRKVSMTLNLDSSSRGQRIARQSYTFNHAINSDRETFHYSTDFPGGGVREVRDLNRNQVIDRADTIDPFLAFFVPDEDVTFSSMFIPGDAAGRVTNVLGEDLDNDGVLDAGEDIIPNGALDRGILFSPTGPTTTDKVPWNFDGANGGWVPIRHPGSTPTGGSATPVWEYKTNGICGYQTSTGTTAAAGYGIWHSGDGSASTPGNTATGCDQHSLPRDPETAPRAEMLFDILLSPIVAKVHQTLDSRGFEYGVEFQRSGWNINIQTHDAYAGGGINIDNNIDNDSPNCILCQQLDQYALRRYGGWFYGVFRFSGQNFDSGTGINPGSSPPQRTFGPFIDPNGGTPSDGGGETGFSGFQQNGAPMPTAPPDFLPYPLPGAPVPGVCSGGTAPGSPCQSNTDCAGGGTCTLAGNTVAGPVRSFDTSLVNYEGGSGHEILFGTAALEEFFFFQPGPAGNRWQLALGFFSIENSPPNIADYGIGVDDVVFEWDEHHPADETAAPPSGLGRQPACQRFGGAGQPAGSQCATITVDRTELYECEESIQVAVFDPNATGSSIEVMIVTDSDSIQFSTIRFSVLKPNAKRHTLDVVAGQPGYYRGNIPFSSVSDNPDNVLVNPANDAQYIVYYVDPDCDGDTDGVSAENDFDNLDGDNVAFAVDNCAFTYNPGQEDSDTDGVGNICDNCVSVPNPGQEDANADDVGDACEFDDIDADGTDNAADNCKDVYNPGQENGDLDEKGDACDLLGDRDGDGHSDTTDNCVLVSNGNQRDTDQDGLGDRCDGDCAGAVPARVCNNTTPTIPCTTDAQCGGTPGTCQLTIVNAANPTCSAIDDDADADGVGDSVDTCAAIANPPIIPGTIRQLDSDRDGLGDACDPAASFDDDFDGVPDDLVTFSGSISCRVVPLGRFVVISSAYLDMDGDHDAFPDTSETGRVQVVVRNLGADLTGVSFTLSSTDPDVACIIAPVLPVGPIAFNQDVVLGSLDPGQPGFTFKASDALTSTSASNPARTEFCLNMTSNEAIGTATPLCFFLLADLDAPQGVLQTFVNGPDGAPNTADDGTIAENFDIDKDGDGSITVNDIFRTTDQGTGQVVHGTYIRGNDTGVGLNVVAGIACGGYLEEAAGNAACTLDPDFPMDWHLHCSPTPAPDDPPCDNTATGTCVGGCSYDTPAANGERAFSPPNSLHMGAHFNAADGVRGDTTHLRAIQGVLSIPINLAVQPRPGDLQLSMWHIAQIMDNNGVGGGNNERQCADCADVQIQVDTNEDEAIDEWGHWEKLAPFLNVYDHKVIAFSAFDPQYCIFTPAGDSLTADGQGVGTAPPAPRGVHETMCFPQGAWSSCGDVRATSPFTTRQCSAPGTLDPTGEGVWVETKFNLAAFLGQRVRIRWIANSWVFDFSTSSYFEYGGGFAATTRDDGWYLDNISLTGAITTQTLPALDPKTPPVGTCPTGCNTAVGDRGTSVALRVTDLADATIAGGNVAVAGQGLRVSAVGSAIIGGCPNGSVQFRFLKNGVVAQDWSAKAFYQDAPENDTSYTVLVRCSSDFACTSQTGQTAAVAVYKGDSTDISLTATHAAGTTSLRWLARPQAAPLVGYDLFRATASGHNAGVGGMACLATDVPQTTIGNPITVNDASSPAVGSTYLYLVGHSSPTAGARIAIGRASNGTVQIAPVSCP
jgi:hypothetical protein